MGVLYTISIDYFKLPKIEYAKVFTTGLFIPFVFSILLVPLLYFFQLPLERAFNFQPNFFWLIPVCLFLNFCFEAFIILVRNQNNVTLFSLVSFLKVIMEVCLSILFIVWLYQNWYSRALAFLLSGLVLAFVFLYHINKHQLLVKNIDTKVLRKEFSFGLSGMLLQTAIFFINASDKFFVMSFFGKDQAGYYSVASTFATIQYIVCISLLQYLQPVLFRRFAEGKKWRDVKAVYYKYLFSMVATLVAVGVFSIVVYHYMLRAAYKEYLHYFYILSISSFLWTISNILLQYIVFTKNKNTIVQVSTLAIAIAIGINYFTSKFFGINWLAGGQVVVNLIIICILLLYSKKLNFFA